LRESSAQIIPSVKFGSAKIILLGAAVVLFLLALAYQFKAFKLLAHGAPDPNDLYQRWLDEHYILRGQNPYDIYFRYREGKGDASPALTTNRNDLADPVTGPPLSEGYPPWSFFTGLVQFPFPFAIERIYWAAICLASLIVLGWWGWVWGQRLGGPRELSLFFTAAILAVSTLGTCISLGQLTTFILSAIILAAELDDWAGKPQNKGRSRIGANALAGVMLGMAMSKPQLAIPFLLVFLIRGRIWTLGFTAVYLAIASTAVWCITKTGPLEMLQQMKIAASQFAVNPTIYGPIQVLARHGVPLEKGFLWTGVFVPIIAGAAMLAWRNAGLLPLFAVAGAAGRLWTYHPLYDNGLLLFLLLAFGVLAVLATKPKLKLGLWIGFAIVGVTLWPRPKSCDIRAYQDFQLLVWTLAPIVLLWAVPARSPTRAAANKETV
jgi:hypothetical protein